jgi:RNA polymerase sigma-70 factor, ECF subfamily
MNDISKFPDEKVVEIVRTKDKELYVEIIKRYQAKLLRYATYILNDKHMGADAVQESFIKAYINLNGFNINKKFSSWIYRIVHNEAINILRKQKKQLPINEKIDIDSGINLEDDFIKNELKHHMQECLNKISVIYREPLSLYYLEEKSYEEISDILRVPVGTVGTRINRAKGLMKKICQK